MRDDPVRMFQRISALRIEMSLHGPTPAKVLQLATYSIALGQPLHAIEQINAILVEKDNDPVIVREAIWLATLSLALQIAILDGQVTGAPGLKITKTMNLGERKEKVKELRKSAIDLLEGIPELDADEMRLLRSLRTGASLKFVQDLVMID